MFKAVAKGRHPDNNEDSTIYMLGLDAVNLFRLAKGLPIEVKLSDLVEGNNDVIMIFAGEDAVDCAKQLRGVISPEVPIHSGKKPLDA